MARKALTRKQILAGFGGSRRKSLAKKGNRRLYTPADKKRKSSSVKRKSSSKRPVGVSVAVYAGVAAAAAAAGLTVAKYVKQMGGWTQFKTKAGTAATAATAAASGIVGSVASWLAGSPSVVAGVTQPITPAQQTQIFKTIPAAAAVLVPPLGGDVKALPFFEGGGSFVPMPLEAPAIVDQGAYASLGLSEQQSDAYGLNIDWNM